jgi:DNA-binding NarL/FixJ family response regulator
VIRLVLADDQALVRQGLRLILSAEDDLEVVAECADGQEAIDAVARSRPDLVLLDVRMPRCDGLEATRRIKEVAGAPPVLVLTTFDDDDVLWGAVRAGAAGFVLKDTPAEDLVAAIRVTAAGGSWLDPRVTPRLLAALRAGDRQGGPGDASRRALLARVSQREREVLELMATGATNAEIAARLYVSERTVKSHVGAIFTKLEVRDRAGAIVLAFEGGLVRRAPR